MAVLPVDILEEVRKRNEYYCKYGGKNIDTKKHLAIILDNEGNIMSVGYNVFQADNSSIHAEDNAIRNLLNLVQIKRVKERRCRKLIMYVLSVRKNGNVKNSKPCENCQKILEKYDFMFNKIYYSMTDNIILRYK